MRFTGSSIAIGLVLGTAIGITLDSLMVGVSAGLILGIAIGQITKWRDRDD
jgi:predicted MFS family arabinose efflux permease